MKKIGKFLSVSGFARRAGLALLAGAGGLAAPLLMANPEGANVVHGDIGFSGLGTGSLTINQGSPFAIINWQNFSIGAGETTHFNQAASAWALNRVVSGNPTAIYGTLSATGNIMVINPSGILVGPSGVIDVAGMATLSTLDMTNEDFLNGGANRFFGDSFTGVTNQGSIISRNGDLALLGGFAHNQGILSAAHGTVFMAAAGDVVVDPRNGISIRANSAYNGVGVDNQGSITGAAANLQASGNVFSMAINNGGIVRATGGSRQGGRSVLFASGGSRGITNTGVVAARNASGTGGEVEITGGAVSNSGALEASGSVGGSVKVYSDSLVMSDSSVVDVSSVAGGGSVLLDANSTATVGGRVDASASALNGGRVVISANDVTLNSAVDVTGGTGGGQAMVGGGLQGNDAFGIRESSVTTIGSGARLDASARMGNAGSVVIWSNGDTIFEGEARAQALGSPGNGGLIEVSGLQNLTINGVLSATSVNGKAGTVLFDPGSLTIGNTSGTGAIAAGPNVIASQTINDLLQGGTSVIVATQGSTSDITFADTGLQDERHDAIQWTTAADFGAFAGRNILVNTHIRNSGEGSINLVAGWTGTEALVMGLFNGTGYIPPGSASTAGTGALSVEDIFGLTVESGLFGQSGGSILVGNQGMARHVEVGSRFGDTNVAGNTIAVIAADTAGESRYAQIGFRDSGQVFAPRRGTLDLNGNASTADNSPAVGIAGRFERDRTGDGIVDGVYAIGSIGILDFDTTIGGLVPDTSGGSDPTFIPYANHYMDARQGNWWWQQIAAASGDTGPGSLRPENGAGTATTGADINVIATGSVMVLGGGRHQSSAQIGHGGDSAGWGDDRSLNDAGNTNGTVNRWAYNGATNDRSANSIARLGPVYGNINVLAGVNASSVSFDHDGGVTASLIAGTGSVLLRGVQRIDANVDAGAASLIGHGGLGQFGEYNGDIQVRAGGSVELIAGANTRTPAQIGHSSSGYAHWDPPSNADAQIRFFLNSEDFNDPHLRRGELFSGNVSLTHLAASNKNAGQTDGGDGSGPLGSGNQGIFEGGGNELAVFATTPTNPVPALTAGPVTVAALDGSTINGYHGNITVEAISGNVSLQGYNTPSTVFVNKDRRFAMIGHGGTSFAVGDEASGFDPTRNDRVTERMQFRAYTTFGDNTTVGNTTFNNLESQSGSLSVTGENNRGDAFTANRALTFMTITGDISVKAGSDINVKAGNDTYDFATIGHGGNELADYETSSFIAGNIDVEAGGDLNIVAAGQVLPLRNPTTPAETRHMRSQAQVGHGGFRSGFMSYQGDISVQTGGDITITGGAFGDSYAKIGHRGSDDIGQVGGNYSRAENFLNDGLSTNITATVNGTTGTVTYSKPGSTPVSTLNPNEKSYTATADKLSGGSFTSGDNRTRTFNLTSNTANITVDSGGTVELNHFASATIRRDLIANRDQREDSYAQIGHGGSTLAAPRLYLNPSTYYVNLVGDIRLDATDDLIMESGDVFGTWSRVGHGITGRDFRVRDAGEMLMSGAIDVNVGRDVLLDGTAIAFVAGAQGTSGAPGDSVYDNNLINLVQSVNPEGPTLLTGEKSADGLLVARDNGLAIGHGAMSFTSDDNVNIAVVGGQVNGVNTSSNIVVNAGRDVTLIGGNGTSDSATAPGSGVHTQIGHGAASDNGNDRSVRGFNGNISVSAQRNVSIEGSNNGYIEFGTAAALNSMGAAAFIGNGGLLMDSGATGDISVYAASDLQLGQDERRRANDILNLTGAFTSLFNFAKIGHVSAENIDSGVVAAGLMDGDISVVVGNNLDMWGGRTLDHSSVNFRDTTFIGDPGYGGQSLNAGVTGAFSQIGHGGPGVDGTFLGEIEVLVGKNLTTHDGTTDVGGGTPYFDSASPNNYVMIGHGDWLRDGNDGFKGAGGGLRQGDIVIAVGENADFENSLVGHIDPAVATTAIALGGNTSIAVSRDYPFYGRLSPNNATLVPGAGFANGTYANVPLTGGSGTGATANLVVSGGSVVSVDFVNRGSGYQVGDELSAAGFTGFSIDLAHAPATLTTTGITDQADAVGSVISPFTAGGSNLVSGTVVTSGLSGSEPLRVFMPERDSNLMGGTTRLNSNSIFYAGRPVADFPTGTGSLSGAADEVFLSPDLWWMDAGAIQDALTKGYTNTGGLPTSAGSGQGGAVAEVETPGALPNITALQQGALGSSANAQTYRSHSLGGGLYTLYYDAVEPVTETVIPTPPVPPTPPPSVGNVVAPPPPLFDAYQRQQDALDALFGNQPSVGFALDDLPYRQQLADDMGVPNWFLEEMLDMNAGPRQSGGTPAQSGALRAAGVSGNDQAPFGAPSTVAQEDSEERERQEARNSRVNQRLGLFYYIYDPTTNYYSSFRMFGRAAQ